MLFNFWIRVGAKEYDDGTWEFSTISATKKKPQCTTSQLAMYVTMEVPDELFAKPLFEIEVTLPNVPIRSKGVTAKVAEDVEEFLKKKTGLSVNVTMAEPEDE